MESVKFHNFPHDDVADRKFQPCFSFQEQTLYTIKGMLIMDNDGNRILSKYYDKNIFPTVKEQKQYEKNLFSKTHRANAEIIMLDGLTVVYKSNVDLFFYVMGGKQENELILLSVLNCLFDTISLILKKNVEKRALFDNLDVVMLAFDEICDGGWVREIHFGSFKDNFIEILESFLMRILRVFRNVSTYATMSCRLANRLSLR